MPARDEHPVAGGGFRGACGHSLLLLLRAARFGYLAHVLNIQKTRRRPDLPQ